MRKPLLPKVSVTKHQSADITELPEAPLKPGYFRTKSNLRTPGGFPNSLFKTLIDETRLKDGYNQFCDRVSETSTSMLNKLQDLSSHVEDIGRPFEKYYEKSSIKSRKGIHSILDINYDFYKNDSTQKRSYDVTSPKFFIFTSIPNSPKRRPYIPTSPKKYHGIHLLDTPITLHPSRQFKNMNTPKHAETRAKLQLKIDTNLDRKESMLANLNISIQSPVLLTSTLASPTKTNKSDQKLPVPLVSKNNSQSIQHANQTDLRNNSNASLQFSIRRRKQLMEEIIAKDSLNVEKIETIMQQSDVSLAIDSSPTYKNTTSASKGNIRRTKTRAIGHTKQSDSIGCQILALDGAQRRKIKERLKSVLPNNTTFDKFFTNA